MYAFRKLEKDTKNRLVVTVRYDDIEKAKEIVAFYGLKLKFAEINPFWYVEDITREELEKIVDQHPDHPYYEIAKGFFKRPYQDTSEYDWGLDRLRYKFPDKRLKYLTGKTYSIKDTLKEKYRAIWDADAEKWAVEEKFFEEAQRFVDMSKN